MSGTQPPSLLDLGIEVVYEVLSHLSPVDLLRARQVCRTLHAIADDDVLWRRHLLNGFHFPLHSSARLSGWRQLYKGMARPHLWVWGDTSDERLGLGPQDQLEQHVRRAIWDRSGVPFPLELPHRDQRPLLDSTWNLRDMRPDERFSLGSVVELHPGGWSFVYLTSEGYLLASGKLSAGVVGIPDRRRSNRSSIIPWLDEPTLLVLEGKRVLKVACGGSHLVTIVGEREASADRAPLEIIVWREWTTRRSFSLAGLDLGEMENGSTRRIEQLENGWDFTAILVQETSTSTSRAYSQAQERTPTSQVFLWLRSWDHDVENALELPSLPPPPSDLVAEFDETSEDPSQGGGHHLITRIGGGEGFIVALTASGLVYKLNVPGPDAAAMYVEVQRHAREIGLVVDENFSYTPERRHAAQRRLMARSYSSQATRWELLRHFCEPQRILDAAPEVWKTKGKEKLVQRSTRMTHLTAHFRQFVVYSAKRETGQGWKSLINESSADSAAPAAGGGIVLLGHHTDHADSRPDVKPALQGADIIKVVAGDWHYGALDAHGNVFTWGQWSKGALGTYDHFQAKGSVRRPEQASRYASEADEDSDEGSPSPPPARVPQSRPGIFNLGRRLASAVRIGQGGANPYLRSEESEPRVPPVRTRNRQVPTSVPEPMQVCFDSDTAWQEGVDEVVEGDDEERPYWLSDVSRRGKHHFVFDIGFAGWHSGALSIERSLLQQ